MKAEKHSDVLIVGAGPTGLMMAAQLLRYGVNPVIIDSRSGPSAHSKALVVQARTLEIYKQLGIAGEAVAGGRQLAGAELHLDDEHYTVELRESAQDVSEFPYALIYEQNKNERLLLSLLTQNACPVLWETELLDYTMGDGLYHLRLKKQGENSMYTCRYLIGADGAHSRVRRLSGIAFGGGTYASQFYLADVRPDTAPDNGHLHFYMRGKDFLGVFPMQDPGLFRLIGMLPPALRGKDDLRFDDVRPLVAKLLPLGDAQCVWFTLFKLHYRHVNAFSKGRIFLAGDAAHIHSPAGGQGMNTGLQDAANLGWKLAGVLRNDYPEKILETYNAERLPLARMLVRTADRAFSFLTSSALLFRTLRKLFLPFIMRYVGRSAPNMRTLFGRISQTAIGYRHSRLSMHLSHKKKLSAGHRLPYFRLYDEKKQGEISLHGWCREPGFSLIVMDRLNRIDMQTMRRWLVRQYPDLHTYYLPWSERNEAVFQAFDVLENDKKMVLVRPDGYIALLADGVDLLLLRRYFEQVIGLKRASAQPGEAQR